MGDVNRNQDDADPSATKHVIDFLTTSRGLKTTLRTGWVRQQANPRIESVADHSWRISLMALVVATSRPPPPPPRPNTSSTNNLDTAKLVQMALVHDLAESTVGDITPYCGVSDEEKHQREYEAMRQLTKNLPGESGAVILRLWQEYEKGESAEAKICKDLDKLEMILQALEYEQDGKNRKSLDGFFDSTREKWRTSLGKTWGKEIESRRESTNHPAGTLDGRGNSLSSPPLPPNHKFWERLFPVDGTAAAATTSTGRCGFTWHLAATLGFFALLYPLGMDLYSLAVVDQTAYTIAVAETNDVHNMVAVVSTVLISLFLAAPMVYFVANSSIAEKDG